MTTITATEQEILKDVLNNPGDLFYENVLSDFLDEQGIEHDFRKPLHNNRIEELKTYYKRYLDIWANHWINIALCTKPTNEDKAEQYFYDIYEQLGLEKPKSILWFNNPVEMCNQVNNQIRNQVNDQIWGQFRSQIWRQVRSRISDKIAGLVNGRVWNKVRSKTKSKIVKVNGETWFHMQYSQHDTCLFAFYAYIAQVLRMEPPKLLAPCMLLAQEVNCWFPTKKTVYATRKPKECIVKDGKLIKIVYQDGCTVE